MDINGVPYIKNHIPYGTKKKRPGYKMDWQMITVHDTANPDSRARGERNYLTNLNNPHEFTGWHICVDEKEAVEALPLNEVAWHANDGVYGDGNRKSIGVEICLSGSRSKTLMNAAEVVTSLLREKGKTTKDLRQHYDWSKKNCPSILRANNGKGWRDFLVTIESLLKNEEPNLLDAAVQTLAKEGIITSPEYWRANCETGRFVKGEFVASLILKAAEKLRKP